MKLTSLLWLAGTILGVSTLGAADLPPGGTAMFSPDDINKFSLGGNAHRIVQVEDQPFKDAAEADVQGATDAPWGVQYTLTNPHPIKRGDIVHLRFHARNVYSMTGSAVIGIAYELNQAPHSKSLDRQVTVGTSWQVVDLPFVAKQDFDAGRSQLCFRLAYAKQKLQIGGLQLINYGKSVQFRDLPQIRQDYAGRAADAPWRQAAEERIEKIRKSDLKLIVQDASGNPVQNAQVSAELSKHAFGFGTCISMRLLEDSKDGEMYRQKVKELFSTTVLENELKWPNIEWHKYSNSDRLVQWLLDNNISVRGHCLVWPGKQYLPKRVLALEGKPEEMKKAIEDHVRTTAARYSGKLIDWDVINEPFTNHYVMDQLGQQVMVDWFKIAREADPKATLYINDYEILASGNMLGTPHQNHYYNTIKYLKDNGAPVQGIGMQGHFGTNLTSPDNLLKILDRFSEFGLRIKVTELDINMDDQELRADYMRDFHIALFSHPSVDGILQWGFWEGAHWIPGAAMYDRDWTLRPHGQAFIDLVHNKWKTKAQGTTDAAGRFALRGFHGDYNVVVTIDGKATTHPVVLKAGGSEAVVQLK